MSADEPIEQTPPRPLTVTQLTQRVKRLLEEQIGWVLVEGEISNCKVSPAGHAYFVLKDEGASISCVMFRNSFSRLDFACRDGQRLIAEGQVGVYESRGQYQLVVERMFLAGLGALYQKFNEMKQRLEREGLFDPARKRPLPMLPRKVGIVTSPTGAAVRDMLNVLGRRFAGLHVLIAPARVQGAEAPGEIARAIALLNRHRACEVIIVGRGGGSIEDLWAFNEEIVARAIFESAIPIISAVGHETDFTIADFVADLRAPTPSAAAELVIADREALVNRCGQMARRLRQSLLNRVERARLRLQAATGSYAMRSPPDRLAQARQRVDDLGERLQVALERRVEHARQKTASLESSLAALDPKAVLSRGYAIVTRVKNDRVVSKAEQVKPQDQIKIELGKGRLRAVVVKDEDDFVGWDALVEK